MAGSVQIDAITAIETSHPVGDVRFRDFEVWPIVRLGLRPIEGPAPARAANPRQRMLGVVTSIPRAVGIRRRPVTRARARAVFFDQRSSRQRGAGGVYTDMFADPLRRLLRDAEVDLEVWEWRDVVDARPADPSTRSLDLLLARAAVRGAVRGRIGRMAASLTGELTDLRPAVESFGLTFDIDGMVRRTLVVDELGSSMGRALHRGRARLAFVMCFYTLPSSGFCLACRRLGVVSVDVQHGVQGPAHLAYGPWVGEPGPRSALLPDRFWCWTPDDAAWIDEAFGPGRAEVGGNLPLSISSGDVRSLERRVGRRSREILVTLQPGLPLPPAVAGAMTSAPPEWRWWVRPHPMMTTQDAVEVVPASVRSRTEVAAAEALPLRSLLDFVDAHVTAYSSVVLEASTCGVTSFVTAPEALALFRAQIDRGEASLVRTADELERALRTATRHTGGPSMGLSVEAVDRLVEAASTTA